MPISYDIQLLFMYVIKILNFSKLLFLHTAYKLTFAMILFFFNLGIYTFERFSEPKIRTREINENKKKINIKTITK